MTPHELHLMGTSSTANRNSRNVLACQLRFNQSVPNELGWPGTDHTLSSSSSSSSFPVPPARPKFETQCFFSGIFGFSQNGYHP